MNKTLFISMITGIIFLCLITAGCITTSDITGPETPGALDPIFGTWDGQTTNAGYTEYYTMIFNEDGTGEVTVKSMGTELPSDFTWTKSSNLNYKMYFAIAASGFSQQNTLVMNSNEKTCTVIGIEFTRS
jgi:hypothetical protein